MATRKATAFDVPVPSKVEAAALVETVRYLRRAGTRTATLLLLTPLKPHDGVMLEMLRDDLLTCADFCESMLELSDREPEAMASGAVSNNSR
jgi:hypothetical protein